MAPEQFSPSGGIYWIARFSVMVGLKVWNRYKSFGSENVPTHGGCMIAANHVSFLDPPAIVSGIRHRVVHFMARDTLFEGRVRGWFFRGVQCIPIDRTKGDVSALRRGISSLKDGHCLAFFPEGTRSVTGELQSAKGGLGFIVAKAGVAVVPTYVDGTFDAYPKGAKSIKRVPVRVFYGKPIEPSEIQQFGDGRDSYEKISQLVMSRIAALRPKKG
ncbi:MAG TPA: lysophospholipid acyltransferase family protein [Kiritimatiellia bacterium]|nr:lysophospholipid acyltransferase family protein [Kiritimatiellia bacterium]